MDRKHGLDSLDRIILDLLQREGRITNVRLAAAVGLSQASALERVRKLEDQGYIERYVALVRPERVGRGTTAWALVSLSFHQGQSIEHFTRAIAQHPDVLECYHVAGEEDFLIKVVVPDIAGYREFLLSLLAKDMGVAKIRTMMVLDVLKRETRVPLTAEPAPRKRPRKGSHAPS